MLSIQVKVSLIFMKCQVTFSSGIVLTCLSICCCLEHFVMTWMIENLLKTTLLQYGPFISSKMEANG